jgi:hypothetical protein
MLGKVISGLVRSRKKRLADLLTSTSIFVLPTKGKFLANRNLSDDQLPVTVFHLKSDLFTMSRC